MIFFLRNEIYSVMLIYVLNITVSAVRFYSKKKKVSSPLFRKLFCKPRHIYLKYLGKSVPVYITYRLAKTRTRCDFPRFYARTPLRAKRHINFIATKRSAKTNNLPTTVDQYCERRLQLQRRGTHSFAPASHHLLQKWSVSVCDEENWQAAFCDRFLTSPPVPLRSRRCVVVVVVVVVAPSVAGFADSVSALGERIEFKAYWRIRYTFTTNTILVGVLFPFSSLFIHPSGSLSLSIRSASVRRSRRQDVI